MIILLHTSKTMRSPRPTAGTPHSPALLSQATELAEYLKTLSPEALVRTMHISSTLAAKTHAVLAEWTSKSDHQSYAIDSFVGDIYSGLQASKLTLADRAFADKHLRILSGLYGILRPHDGINPYRLEMGYKLPDTPYANLYGFWGSAIAETLPAEGLIVNLSAIEYSKTVTPFVDQRRIVAPRFLTVDPKTGEPTFVVVHTKIARGAFARWMIVNRVTTADKLSNFDDIGYAYDPDQSTPTEPVFVCQEFGGKGLSMRLQS